MNEKCDVAVLRAKKLANSEWASVRLNTSTNKGERIIAIGNPAIDQATINLGGVSIGVVSNPKVAAFGQDELVADITVASGSSGGPLLTLRMASSWESCLRLQGQVSTLKAFRLRADAAWQLQPTCWATGSGLQYKQ